MRLTRMTDYGLRLLMYLGQHAGRLSTIVEIAQAYDVSEAHLMKITHRLAVTGSIVTVRGKGGGMRLAREPALINIGTVVRDLEPDFSLVECFGPDSGCVLTGRCRLARVLETAIHDFMARLDAVTLADLLPGGGRPASHPLVLTRLPRKPSAPTASPKVTRRATLSSRTPPGKSSRSRGPAD